MGFDPYCFSELFPRRSAAVPVSRCCRNFDSVIPVDVIRVKSDMDNFLDSSGVPV